MSLLDRDTIVFLVGAPRSGTTYLQNLLGSHPSVVSSQETDLFTHYVFSLRQHWRRQLPTDPEKWHRARHKGLPAVFTEQEFDSVVAMFIGRVYGATLNLKPSASIVLDKTPQNGRHAAVILHYVPSARFIHIVRDPRDVVTSQLRAARTWGRDWAPGSAASAAAVWRAEVMASRSIRGLTRSYMEVRYEDLLGPSGAGVLADAFHFCGIDVSPTESAATLRTFALGPNGTSDTSLVWGGEVTRRLGSAPPEPAGFAGEGGVGAWRRELDLRDRVAVEREAGDLSRILGYTQSQSWVGATPLQRLPPVVSLAARSVLRRGRNRLADLVRA